MMMIKSIRNLYNTQKLYKTKNLDKFLIKIYLLAIDVCNVKKKYKL